MALQGPTLLISEKNKAARTIAEALGTVRKGNVNGINVYEVPSENLVVIPLRGHMKGYKNVGEYEKWNKKDPRDIITDPGAIAKRVLPGQAKLRDALRILGKQSKSCIIGTDADLEGCNIGIKDALPEVQKVNPSIKLAQLWLHTLQRGDIQNAYQTLIPLKFSWAEAAEARAILDAVIGFSATREVTLTLKSLLQKIPTKVLSIGRVQTALLYLLFLRERGIRNFKPKPYWTIEAVLCPGEASIKIFHEQNPFHDKVACENIFGKINGAEEGILVDFPHSTRNRQPPTPLNTTKALLLLTKHLKISSSLALKTMEDLYLDQLISYPRTDSDRYESNFNHSQYLQQFATHADYGPFTQQILQAGRTQPTQGKVNAGDHSPITPVTSVPLSSTKLKSVIHRNAYDLLVRHYLALFAPPAKEIHGTLRVSVHQEPFKGSLTGLLDPGFLAIIPQLSPKYDQWIPLKPGQTYPIRDLNQLEKETQPPARFTDTSVIELMERNGLGTKSTRPETVEILLRRGYIFKKGRTIFVSELGYNLMENLEPIWKDFLLPNFTSHVEQKLDAVKAGEVKRQDIVEDVKKEFLELFDRFLADKPKFVANMQQTDISNIAGKGKGGKGGGGTKKIPIPYACPKCGKNTLELAHTYNKKRLIRCAEKECDFALFFPKRGAVYLQKSKKCSICGFPPVKITTRTKGRSHSYFICPLCWNKGLREKIPELGFCPKCDHFLDGTCTIKPSKKSPGKKRTKSPVKRTNKQ